MHPAHTRPRLEALESRWCPAATATLAGGILAIRGTSTDLAITQTAAGTFDVTDGGTSVTGAPFTSVNTLGIVLNGGNDGVTIDLGGFSLPGRALVNLGQGNNTLTVTNGTVTRDLLVTALGGTDTVTVNNVTVKGQAGIAVGTSAGDSVALNGTTRFEKNLGVAGANTFTLASTASIGGRVLMHGDAEGSTTTIQGTIAKDLVFTSAFFRSKAANTMTIEGTVSGNVGFTSSVFSDAGSTLRVSGTVGRNLGFVGSDKADTLEVTSTGKVGGTLIATLRAGDDTVTLTGQVGKSVVIDGGWGDETVTVNSSARIGGDLRADLGLGDDTFRFNRARVAGALRLVGGWFGTDQFSRIAGTVAGLLIDGFEIR